MKVLITGTTGIGDGIMVALSTFQCCLSQTANTIRQLGQAMIYAAQNAYEKKVVEVGDIKILAASAKKQKRRN